MSLLKSTAALVLLGLLIVEIGHAQESEDCPYPKGREVQDLATALAAHEEWVKEMVGTGRSIPGRANFCNADLSDANLEGAILSGANLQYANLSKANLKGANLWDANFEGANLSWANLQYANMRMANLEGAFLPEANLEGANLSKANLRIASLTEVNLQNANLREANLEVANLREANLEGANLIGANLEHANLLEANLTGANLSAANLQGAKLIQAVLEDAKLYRADLSEAFYQPATAPAQGYLSGLTGLRSVKFCPGEGSGLVQLRTALKAAGLNDLEREATYALERGRTRHALARWNAARDETFSCSQPERDRMAAFEGVFRLIFFEWTTDYGLNYGRPILIFLGLIAVFTLIYLPALVIAPKRPDHSGIYRIWPEGRIKRGSEGFETADDVIIEPLNTRGIAALGLAFYFSVISAFHLGWRDLNVGTWIARMQPREYALRAKGWVRVVSGVQSLISVYLIAMWVLTYFGRPFE